MLDPVPSDARLHQRCRACLAVVRTRALRPLLDMCFYISCTCEHLAAAQHSLPGKLMGCLVRPTAVRAVVRRADPLALRGVMVTAYWHASGQIACIAGCAGLGKVWAADAADAPRSAPAGFGISPAAWRAVKR